MIKKLFILPFVFLICIFVQTGWAVTADFAVIADPHFYDTDLGTTGEAFEAYLTQDRKMIREGEAILASAVKTIRSKKPDFVIVAGDLTKDGELSSHGKFAQYLAKMEKSGIKVYVGPGNHDINNPHAFSFSGSETVSVPGVSPEEFAQIYAEYGYGEALYRDAASLSYIAEPVDGIWIFSIDSCKYESNYDDDYPKTGGAIRVETMAWILEKLQEARSQGKQVIGFMHHGVTEHYQGQSSLFGEYVVDGWEEVSTKLASAGLKMVFTGHYHANDITESTPLNGGPTLFDIETGSLVTYPSPFRFVTLLENKAAIQTKYVEKIDYDTGDLSFPEYAKAFLYEGLLTIAVNTLTSQFGLDAATAAYLAPGVADAFTAHYTGDETPDSTTLTSIYGYMSSDDPTTRLLGMTLYSLWTDLAPADADTFLDFSPAIKLAVAGTYASGVFDDGGAEILAYDPETQRVFVTSAAVNAVDVLHASNPAAPVLAFSIPMNAYGGGVNSVAIKNGILAVAVEADPKQNPGKIVFFDTNGTYLNDVPAGALPDMVIFTPDGSKVLSANEGEPSDDYTDDPEGSVTIVDLSLGVANASAVNATFGSFNGQKDDLKAAGVRIFGPNATVAQDLEPEYIAISEDSSTAWVTCQENNAMAVIDIASGTVKDILPLFYKDYSLGYGLDASNKDGSVNIQTYDNLYGMIQPDAVAAFQIDGQTYLITANEGDARDYDGFSEETKVSEVVLDTSIFSDVDTLQKSSVLGNLKITSTLGDSDGDGVYEALYAFGGRSFSIFKANEGSLELIFDSGDQMEQITGAMLPNHFNATNDKNNFDNRSDDKGPEPEGLALGTIEGRIYAFIGLERIGGIMVYDISDPEAPVFVQYINNRDFSAEIESAGDLAPEGLVFIPASESPSGKALLGVSNEISGTTTLYSIEEALKADLNGDGTVDRNDVSLLKNYLRQPAEVFPPADMDGDGTITVRDARKIVNSYTSK